MDEPIVETPVETVPVETTPVETPIPDAPADGTSPVVDDAEAMWGDIKPEAAPVDPAAPAVPEAFTKALSMSDYVKEPAHLESAISTASQVWDVVAGKGSASGLLEAMRTQNPQQYEKTILEDIVPYIEKITGKKFGAAEATPDPIAEMRAELERVKQQPLLEAQQREQQQKIDRAYQVTATNLETYIKNGNGIFEGNVQGAMDTIAAQLPKLGVTSDQLMTQVLSGNTTTLEKAYKAAEKAKTLEVKAYADAVKKRYATLKGSVPASKGGGSLATPSSEAADLTTQAGRAKWMAEQFKSGADIN